MLKIHKIVLFYSKINNLSLVKKKVVASDKLNLETQAHTYSFVVIFFINNFYKFTSFTTFYIFLVILRELEIFSKVKSILKVNNTRARV